MRTTRPHLAVLLATLAIVLHVVATGLGGKLCVRVTPLPASDGCPSQCCEAEQAAAVQVMVLVAFDGGEDTDCCLDLAGDYLARGVDQLDDRGVGTQSAGQPSSTFDRTRRAGPRSRLAGTDALPSPSLLGTRSTVLRL
ncbi:MAG: hypothetical protein HKO59_14785 [Phycisphaerales bacterium]|nr:hypothetical protein [Phycisphaerae bacterium]NNF41991.1 hypothetical protein [Phycisphaerales bacterium]NNM27224.1 hypothetical protein [Phycisphaerales bacterium]